jgi:glutamate synthase (NADPH/NADH) large chain/glutamate synthase (ferredoxin)
MAGYPISQAVMMMIPEPWEYTTMDERRKGLYEYHAAMLELWTGVHRFTDGRQIGATRPTAAPVVPILRDRDDDLVIMASESGAAHPRAQDHPQNGAPAARQDVPDRPAGTIVETLLINQGPRCRTASRTSSGSRTQQVDDPPRLAWFLMRNLVEHTPFDRQQASATPRKTMLADGRQRGSHRFGNDSPLVVLSNKSKAAVQLLSSLRRVTNPPTTDSRSYRHKNVGVLHRSVLPNLLDINQVNPPMPGSEPAGAQPCRHAKAARHRIPHAG